MNGVQTESDSNTLLHTPPSLFEERTTIQSIGESALSALASLAAEEALEVMEALAVVVAEPHHEAPKLPIKRGKGVLLQAQVERQVLVVWN